MAEPAKTPAKTAAPKFGGPKPVAAARPNAGPVVKMTGKESKDFQGIIRILGRDVEGHTQLRRAFIRIRGMGENMSLIMARNVQRVLGIPMNFQVGELSEAQILKIEDVLKDPTKVGVRQYMFNHRKDRVEGKDKHHLATDLQLAIRGDIETEKITRSYRGWRHAIGQRVRGQHSRSTGRTGMSVGVVKKKEGKGSAAPAEAKK